MRVYRSVSGFCFLKCRANSQARGRRASRRTTSLTAPYSFASTALSFWPLSRKYRPRISPITRSEEHTSELQSQSNLVCRLLLEKKKINTKLLRQYHHPVHRPRPC